MLERKRKEKALKLLVMYDECISHAQQQKQNLLSTIYAAEGFLLVYSPINWNQNSHNAPFGIHSVSPHPTVEDGMRSWDFGGRIPRMAHSERIGTLTRGSREALIPSSIQT